MQKALRRMEMDRPTRNSLQFITSVRPHLIRRDNFLVDPFVYDTLSDTFGVDVVEEFGSYTRSFYTLEGHYHNLWLYDRKILPKPQDPLLDLAIRISREEFRLDTPVHSYGWHELAKVPFIANSSAGWNYIGNKGAPGNHETAISRAVLSLKWWSEDQELRPSQRLFKYHPDLAWTRTQIGTVEDPKIRNVWGKAFENIILEGMQAYPLIQAYRKRGDPMPLGINYFKRLPTMINRTLSDGINHNYGVGIDYKSFDSSIQPWLINECFDILKENILFPDIESQQAWRYNQHFFIHTPVVMPDGRLWYKHLGVPSGSYFTQLIDSIANHIVTTYAQLSHYGRSFKTYVLGDDSLFGVPIEFGYPSLDYFRPHAAKLGLLIHPEKGCIAEHPSELEFLGHCAYGSRVDRQTAGMMRLALYPEHPVVGPAHSLQRIKGILLDSALNSWPLIHLHNMMVTKYREFQSPIDQFTSTEKDWFLTVLDLKNPPSYLNEVTIFTLT